MRKKAARYLALGLVGLLIQQGSATAWFYPPPPPGPPTATPIKHLVVIFPENISFDHYFATYPVATNPSSEPPFYALPGPTNVKGLNGALLTDNPGAQTEANGVGALNPYRLDHRQTATP